jgi:tyrosine-protein phosphatase SIW14
VFDEKLKNICQITWRGFLKKRHYYNFITAFAFFISFMMVAAGNAAESKTRPSDWAQPVIGASLENFYRVSDDLYRSEQPEESDIRELKAAGIKSVLSLRDHHKDDSDFDKAGIKTIRYEMKAGSVSTEDLIAVLKLIQSAPKPILVHCWHGSDRTGFIVAGYRMVFMDWDVEKAIEELRSGGFGYHERYYPNIKQTLRQLNIQEVRQSVIGSSIDAPSENTGK